MLTSLKSGQRRTRIRIVAIVGNLARTRNGSMIALLPPPLLGELDDDGPVAMDGGASAAASLELVVRRWVAVLSVMVHV